MEKPKRGLLEELFNLDRPEPLFPDKEDGRRNSVKKGKEECPSCGSMFPPGGQCPGCGLMDEEMPWGTE